MVLALTSCCRDGLRSGDLLFVEEQAADSASMGAAIASATGRVTHVAILEVSCGKIFVIDATGRRGVDRHPLDTLIADFTADGATAFHVKRLKDRRIASAAVRKAKTFIGLPYDWHFRQDNGAFYCSELVQECYEGVFPLRPMNFAGPDGTMPEFWQRLFADFGEPVPQGEPGTSPQGMFDDGVLEPVRSWTGLKQ